MVQSGMWATFEHLRRIELVRFPLLGHGDIRTDLRKVCARGEVCDAVRHDRKELWGAASQHDHHVLTLAAVTKNTVMKWGTYLLNLILQLSDTVHMSEFLQHVAAFGEGRKRRSVGETSRLWRISMRHNIPPRAQPEHRHFPRPTQRSPARSSASSPSRRLALVNKSFPFTLITHTTVPLIMGNDGGSIPDRRDLVKSKAKVRSLALTPASVVADPVE